MSARCKDLNDFGWLRHLRFEYDDDDDESSANVSLSADALDRDGGAGGGAGGPMGAATSGGLHMRCADRSIRYAYEFYGAAPVLYITPATERYIMLLTQSMGDVTTVHGSLLTGTAPLAATRKETVQAVSGLCGNFLLETSCTAITDGASLGRLLTGLSRSGASGAFYEFDCLTNEAMAVFAQQIQTLALYMRAGAVKQQYGDDEDKMFKMPRYPDCRPFGVFLTASANGGRSHFFSIARVFQAHVRSKRTRVPSARVFQAHVFSQRTCVPIARVFPLHVCSTHTCRTTACSPPSRPGACEDDRQLPPTWLQSAQHIMCARARVAAGLRP
jgi:hypothetical protein